MALDSSPICFRVSEEERVKLEAAASYVGQSLSAFMRRAAIDTADQVMKTGGGEDAVIERYNAIQQRRAQFASRKP
jgi:Protein of unknown function (DUF1778)